jgi:hypothetical protein
MLRRQMRTWIVAWLLFQCVSVSALAVRDCCCQPQEARAEHCQKQTPATYCPMRAADGSPCPMHQQSEPDCVMRGTCSGPIAAVGVLFATWGIPVASFELLPDQSLRSAGDLPTQSTIESWPPADTPPPKA